jgi:hypothetical protein
MMVYSIKLHVKHLGRLKRTQALQFISASTSINSYALSYSPNYTSAQYLDYARHIKKKLCYIYNIRFYQNIIFRPDKIGISPNPSKIQNRF